VLGGIALLLWLAAGARRDRYVPAWHTPVELGGMYWHFVDIVWVFLWPLFYLLRP
jgi:cytochrome c oxidase subunit 3